MTSLFDAGDLQRLEVERNLTRNTPTVLPEEPGEPVMEELEDGFPEPQKWEDDPIDLMGKTMFATMLEILKERFV